MNIINTRAAIPTHRSPHVSHQWLLYTLIGTHHTHAHVTTPESNYPRIGTYHALAPIPTYPTMTTHVQTLTTMLLSQPVLKQTNNSPVSLTFQPAHEQIKGEIGMHTTSTQYHIICRKENFRQFHHLLSLANIFNANNILSHVRYRLHQGLIEDMATFMKI